MALYTTTDWIPELQLVDQTKTLTVKSGSAGAPEAAGYTIYDFSYSDPGNNGNYTIIGGSDVACHNAVLHLFRALGFRYLGISGKFFKRPTSITPGLSVAKRQLLVNTIKYNTNQNAFGDSHLRFTRMVAGSTSTADDPWPNGHMWQNILQTNVAFFTANPSLKREQPINGTTQTILNVDGAYDIPADWDALTTLCAQWAWPRCNAHFAHNSAFDPTDGTVLTHGTLTHTDLLMYFIDAVAQKLRTGVPAISGYGGIYPARAALPDARLGFLAYNSQSILPTVGNFPGQLPDTIYVKVTSQYNQSGLSFPDLFAAWEAKVHWPVLSYEYITIGNNNYPNKGIEPMPMMDAYIRDNTLDRWNDSPPSGREYEWGYNNLPQTVFQNWMQMLRCDTGPITFDDALADTLEHLFDNDPAVENIYRLWYKQYSSPSYPIWKICNDYVADMRDGSWWKRSFQLAMTFYCKWYRLYQKVRLEVTGGSGVPYVPEQEPLLIECLNLAANMSSFYQLGAGNAGKLTTGWQGRLLGNSYEVHAAIVITYWGYNKMGQTFNPATPNVGLTWTNSRWRIGDGSAANPIRYIVPIPDWFNSPTPFTESMWTEERATIETLADRDAELNDPTLVPLTGIPLAATGTNNAKNNQRIYFPTRCMFVGAGTVTLTALGGGCSNYTIDYPTHGQHEFIPTIGTLNYAHYDISVSGGKLFIDSLFLPQRASKAADGRSYVWINPSAAGRVQAAAVSRIGVIDESGNNDLVPPALAEYIDPRNMGPGVIAIDDTRGGGGFSIRNANPWISNDPEITLAPLELVEMEYPGHIRAVRIA